MKAKRGRINQTLTYRLLGRQATGSAPQTHPGPLGGLFIRRTLLAASIASCLASVFSASREERR